MFAFYRSFVGVALVASTLLSTAARAGVIADVAISNTSQFRTAQNDPFFQGGLFAGQIDVAGVNFHYSGGGDGTVISGAKMLSVGFDNIDLAGSTPHYEGKGERFIPLFPELRPHLEAVWHEAAEGSTHFSTRYRDTTQNLQTTFTKIIRRAGLEPWPKLFQNLRSSRQTELEDRYPWHVVCAWLGNSRMVAQRHYL